VFGCPETIAMCSLLCERLPGQAMDALAVGSPEEWRREVDAPVEKLGKALMIEDALGALRPT
jgi:hypothetical protein